jgi:hypothetical protein
MDEALGSIPRTSNTQTHSFKINQENLSPVDVHYKETLSHILPNYGKLKCTEKNEKHQK